MCELLFVKNKQTYTMDIEPYETGSGGFVWKNIVPDELFSQVKLHAYSAFDMKIDERWAGSQFINHYNRIYYVKSGEALLTFKNKEILMQPGGLYLIPPYQLLSHQSYGELHFSWTHFQAKLDAGLDLFMLYGSAFEVKLDFSDLKDIESAFNELIRHCKSEKVSALFERKKHLLTLLMPFFRELEQNDAKLGINNTKFRHQNLLPALSNINQNIMNPPDIKSLAQSVNLSPEHFSRKFKAAFNVSPKRYIVKKRIALAKQKLLLTPDSIEMIGEQCGFCDIFHFSRIFKQETGSAPSEFRKNYDVSQLLEN